MIDPATPAAARIAELLRVAAEALGVGVLAAVDVPATGSSRSVVVRARLPDGETCIVKSFDPASAGQGWAREAAGLGLLADLQLPAPRLLAEVGDPPVLVMADLGSAFSLADHLLGADAPGCSAALSRWARAVGELQSGTIGRRASFAAQLEARAGAFGADVDTSDSLLTDAAGALGYRLEQVGITWTDAAQAELVGLRSAFETDVEALSPADTCPDNNLDLPDGMRLLDFEGATFRHVVWDAAYLAVPWPTCWCCWQLDDSAARSALAEWRAALAPVAPVDSAAFGRDLDRAVAGWVWISMSWLWDRALGRDEPPTNPTTRAGTPTRRAMITHRLTVAAGKSAVLPALSELAAMVGRRLREEWGPVELALAPAYRP